MNNLEDSELIYVENLYKKRYLLGTIKCKCNKNNFVLQFDKNAKTSKCIFRCINNSCKYRHSVRVYSFFNLFPKTKLSLISEIIKSFMNELNAKKCY